MECKCEIGVDSGHEIVKICRTHGNHVDKMTEGLRLKVAGLEQDLKAMEIEAFNTGMERAAVIAENATFLDAVIDTQIATAELIRVEIEGGEG
jgi:hypothetical protein